VTDLCATSCNRGQIVPARETETRFLNLYGADSRFRVHNLGAVLLTNLPISDATLGAALRNLALRHPMLNARFRYIDGQWWLDTLGQPLISHRSEARSLDPQVDWRSWVVKHGLLQSRLPHFPEMVRLSTLRHRGAYQALVLTLNHSVTDFVGLLVLCNDLSHILEHVATGQTIEPLQSPYTIFDATLEEHRYISSSAGASNLRWWRQFLAGYTADSRVKEPQGRAASIGYEIDGLTFERIRTRIRDLGVTPALLFLCAYVAALHAVTGTTDVLVSFITSRRGLVPRDGDLVACLIDFMLFRISKPSNKPLRVLASELRRQSISNSQRWLPYWLLVREVAPDLYGTTCGIAENEFNYISLKSTRLRTSNLIELLPVPTKRDWLTFRRGVVVTEQVNSWSLVLLYDSTFVAANEARLLMQTILEHPALA
jgi:Condensation domain